MIIKNKITDLSAKIHGNLQKIRENLVPKVGYPLTWFKKTNRRNRLIALAGIILILAPIVINTLINTTANQVKAADVYFGMDEGYGVSGAIHDSNGNVPAGTNTAAWQTEDLCHSGKCLYFDGTMANVSFNNNINLDMAAYDTVTLEAWFRTPDISSGNRAIISKYESVGSDGGYLLSMKSSGQIVFGIDNNNTSFPLYSVTSPNSYDDNQWHHVAAVKDGTSSMSLYMDGILVKTTSIASTNTSNNDSFMIGAVTLGGVTQYIWLGFIDEVSVSHTAKTASQIAADYAGTGVDYMLASIKNGLVGYWKLDEATNTTRHDSSGNANDLTESTGDDIDGVTGKINGGADFENSSGEQEYLGKYVSAGTPLDITGSISLCEWINPETLDGGTVSKIWDYKSYGIFVDTDGSASFMLSSTGSNEMWADTANGLITTGNWAHVCATYDGRLMRIYVNGVQSGTPQSYSSGIYSSTDEFRIGGGWGNYYDGIIDEVRVYNRALSDTEIHFLYGTDLQSHGTAASFGPDQSYLSNGLVGYYKMDENTGSTANDSSGNGNTGTLTNSPSWNGGKFGSGVNFDGVDDYISAANSSSLNMSAGFTLSGWIKPSSITSPLSLNNYNSSQLNKVDGTNDYDLGVTYDLKPYFTVANTEKSWTRYDDPGSAACGFSETYDDGCVLNIGPASSWDDYSIQKPSVIKDGSTYKMWYEGYDGTNYRIGYATSSDGANWTKYDNAGSAACGFSEALDDGCVFDLGTGSSWDNANVMAPTVIKDDSTYKMWYYGVGSSANRSFGYATSSDGISWTRYDNPGSADCGETEANDDGCVFLHGATNTWDERFEAPTVIKDGSTYKMWYSAYDGTTHRTGYATSSDGISWTRYDNPGSADCGFSEAYDDGCVFEKSSNTSAWDNDWAYMPKVAKVGQSYIMTYGGRNNLSAYKLGLATSSDGISWTRYDDPSSAACGKSEADDDGCILDTGGANHWDTMYIANSGTVMVEGSTIRIYYGGRSSSNYRLGLATFTPGINSGTAISSNTWHQITGVKNGTTLDLYIDGVLNSTVTTSATTLSNNSNLLIGNLVNGNLDEIRIYNRALTPAEVRQLYNWVPGPVGWWKMDENAGTSIYDTSGNNITGTLGGGDAGRRPKWAPGKFGSGLLFDGTDDGVGMTDTDLHSFGNGSTDRAFSVSTWLYFTKLTYTQIVSKPAEYDFYTGVSGIYVNLYNSSSTSIYIGRSCSLPSSLLNSWHHLAFTYDGSSANSGIKIYIDGTRCDTADDSSGTYTAMDNKTDGLYLGTDSLYGSPTFIFGGTMDDTKIYNYARTTAQIIEDMNAGHPAPGSPVGSAIGEWKFDEGYGDTANNSGSGGSSLNGNLAGGTSCPQSGDSACPSWTNEGKFGKALKFDTSGTTDDYVDAGNNTSLQLTNTGTVAFWVNYTNSSGNPVFVCKSNWDTDRNGYCVGAAVTTGQIKGEVADGSGHAYAYSINTNYNDGQWHHVVFTWDGSFVKLYIDGELGAAPHIQDYNAVSTTYNLTFGKDPAGTDSNYYLNGKLDDVRIYNSALTEDQVKLLYNQGFAASMGVLSTASSSATITSNARSYCPPGDTGTCNPPVGEWKLDEATNTTRVDTSGNGNDLAESTGDDIEGVYGKFGNAADFENSSGEQEYLVKNISAGTPLDITGNISLCAWIKPESASVTQNIVGKIWSTKSYGLFVETNRTLSMMLSSDGSSEAWALSASGAVNLGLWQYVCGIYDGSYIRIYINGIQSGTPTSYSSGIHSAGDQFRISGAWGNMFDGSIDEVRIYNYARTPAQIAWDYNRGGPVGWWKLDEGSGDTANNASEIGSSINGDLAGSGGSCPGASSCPTWTTGKLNGALDFDGTSGGGDDYVNIPANSVLNLNNGGTIAAWIYPHSVGEGSYGRIVNKSSDTNATGGYSLQMNSDARIGMAIGSSANIVSVSIVPFNQWTYVVWVFDGTDWFIYLNGIRDYFGNMPYLPDTTSLDVVIGNRTGATDRTFDGLIDEVKLFNYPLTPQQVLTEYNAGSALHYGP